MCIAGRQLLQRILRRYPGGRNRLSAACCRQRQPMMPAAAAAAARSRVQMMMMVIRPSNFGKSSTLDYLSIRQANYTRRHRAVRDSL